MSYSIDDWFEEKFLPEFSKLFKEIEKFQKDNINDVNSETSYDIFIKFFENFFSSKEYGRKNDFVSKILKILLNEEDKTGIHSSIRNCFEHLTNSDEEKELISLEYRDGFDKIKCEFNKLFDEER